MERSFWLKKWRKDEIGFHSDVVNPYLVDCFELLRLGAGATVFVPLCGKTVDIPWLIAQGCAVAAIELSNDAVVALFDSMGIEPRVEVFEKMILYQAAGLRIFVGDVFDLRASDLGVVDAIYDRAALVALPVEMRARYVEHLKVVTAGAPQLLVTLEYDQSVMNGPPFSISPEMVDGYYDDGYLVVAAQSNYKEKGLKGRADCTETVWVLK